MKTSKKTEFIHIMLIDFANGISTAMPYKYEADAEQDIEKMFGGINDVFVNHNIKFYKVSCENIKRVRLIYTNIR